MVVDVDSEGLGNVLPDDSDLGAGVENCCNLEGSVDENIDF
jgi:hypothetical protein